MKVILFGPPGAGKGTQAAFLCDRYDIPHISTGELLRAAIAGATPLGERVRGIMAAGRLVDDATVIELVQSRLAADDCKRGFLFDGFPRTMPQAEALHAAGVAVDWVLEIQVPADLVVDRISGRRVHPASGRIYHVKYDPPKRPDIDDATGEALVQRPDDQESTVRDRLRVYQEQTGPLASFYRQLANRAATRDERPRIRYGVIDGNQDVPAVQAAIADLIGGPSPS